VRAVAPTPSKPKSRGTIKEPLGSTLG
jgi:hypothetical protein